MSKKINVYKLLFSAIVLSFLINGCSNFKIPFLSGSGGGDTPVTRAFFVRNEVRPVKEIQQVFINGSLQETVLLVQDAIETVMDTTSFSMRENQENSNLIMTVHSFEIALDSLSELEEYFFVGKYIIGEKNLSVGGVHPKYRVHVEIKGSSNGYMVRPLAEGQVEWKIYKVNPQLNTRTKLPESEYEKYGVGTYRYREKRTYINRKGEEEEFFVWQEIDISDQPISKGILENKLRNKIIELAAVNDITASVSKK